MKSVATISSGVFSWVFALAAIAALPSASQQVPSPKDVVAPTIYVSLDPAGRGSSFQLAAVLRIRPGFHINAREKSEDYLIATDLRAEAPAGFQLGEVSYPKGALHTFTFSKKPLNVYEDTIVLRLPVTALPNAPLGPQHLPLKLRYQACSTEICLPPVTFSLDATINVASSASESKPAHAELFSPK
jgi:Disulphide bond corrector protein DsbC